MSTKRLVQPLARHAGWLVPLLIYIAAFSVRLVYLNQIQAMPTFSRPVMDEKYHVELAHEINSPEGLPKEPFYRAPLYPYFLAALFRVTNNSLYGSRLIQIVLSSLVPVLIYLLGVRLFRRKIAYWASALAVFYPTFLYFDSTLLITFLIVLLSMLTVMWLYRIDGRTWYHFVVAGLFLGVAGLARPNILLFGPALAIWAWVEIRPKVGLKKAILGYLLIGVTTLIVILPVTIRNYIVSGDPVFIAWQGGFNFFIGSNRQASGWSATVPGIDFTWEGGYKEAISFAEKAEGRKLSKSEVSDFWYDQAWKQIKQDPGAYIGLTFRKLALLINGYEIPNNQDMYIAGKYATIVAPLMFSKFIYFPFGLLAPLALIGIVLSFREWRKFLIVYLFLGAYTLSLLTFFVCARYRQPMIPFLLLFAVFAVDRMITYVRQRHWGNTALWTTAFVLLGLASNYDMLKISSSRRAAEDYQMFGNAFLDEGNLAAATMEFKKAVLADSTYGRPYNNLGLISTRRGNPTEAAKYFYKAITVDPNIVETYINYASTFFLQNDPQSAARVLELARKRFPLNDTVMQKLAVAYSELGKRDDAIEAIRESLRLNPNNTDAQQIYRQLIDTASGN
jgi:tetratricopeptide (TPR) repeat protein